MLAALLSFAAPAPVQAADVEPLPTAPSAATTQAPATTKPPGTATAAEVLSGAQNPAAPAVANITVTFETDASVPDVSAYWILPFALLLGCIATAPLFYPKFWEHHYPKVALGLAALVGGYYCFILKHPAAPATWLHEMQEYVSFIALLGSLFMVSGGIVIHVSRKATPSVNTMLLLVGAVAANLFGTTGAAMLLIRPFIRANHKHIKPYHIIFFIFTVANCGGALTPIGDPPLFMGFLKGVPFLWIGQAVWPIYVTCLALLLITFFVIDTIDHGKTERHHQHDAGPAVEIFGFHNFLFIGLIIIGVFRPSMFESIAEKRFELLPASREILMLAAALGSRYMTKPYIYERNQFGFGPIKEVAILFIGIFSTMVPALNYLNNHSDDMPLKTAGQYYFCSGTLSAVLDNAPTYLVFLETKQGQVQKQYNAQIDQMRHYLDDHAKGVVPPEPVGYDEHFINAYRTLVQYNSPKIRAGQVTDPDLRIAMMISNLDLELFLIAISMGSVFFGACTYIGNGPNFMVKSIAESAGVKTPSFFGYIFKYTLPVLIPIYVLIWYLFFVLKLGYS